MQVTVASGKGGTGKTTVATNLAVAAAREGRQVQLIDCDVEEPNCHLFMQPKIFAREVVTVPVPVIDADRCNLCGECAAICQFNALACLAHSVMTFPELCHSCGGCWLVCPEQAVAQGKREIGDLETGRAYGCDFTQGRLRIGEAQVPPLIKRVKAAGKESSLTIIDAPPGTSCPAIAALDGSDFVLLVTEPTPFGLHDLTLAVETVRLMGLPFGVVLNREGIGDDRIQRYCRAEAIPLLCRIPDDRRIAEAYAAGILAVVAVPEIEASFRQLNDEITARSRQVAQ
jgi:MinD superfamily P-loop ATPase